MPTRYKALPIAILSVFKWLEQELALVRAHASRGEQSAKRALEGWGLSRASWPIAEGDGLKSVLMTLSPWDGLKGTNIAQNMTLANNFQEPPAGVTGAAGAAVAQAFCGDRTRRSSDHLSRSRNREFHFAEQGAFAREQGAFARKQGRFCAGMFIRSPISFRRLLANASEPTPRRHAPTPSPTPANEHT